MRYSPCYISDLGLCRPVNETDNSKVYGVLPYIAPEVLRGEPYTQAADIYSFGMVATEVLTGCPPFAEYAHDTALALRICAGLRPEFKIKIPQLLADLISRFKIYDENEFAYQLRESEKYNQSLPEEIRFPNYKLHPQAIYTSRLIDTK
ncbi:11086_t:CDS:2, partial [Paraglomus occultum]